MTIKKFAAPALPTAPTEYDQRRDDQLNQNLRIYFNNLDAFLTAISTPQNGTTANRPTLNLQVGHFYYDTTLGITIYWNGTVWKNSSGTTV
jgi:hypothetical protein